MKTVCRNLVRMGFAAGLLFGGLLLMAAQEPASPAPDNTKMNDRDRNSNQPMADQQKENRPDLEITKQIRQALVRDKSLSPYAHNVKIVTQGGMVTLRGPVHSDEEKKAVEAKAVEVAGEGKVNNQLDVKPTN
jgi:hyperosmotically inducible periplasmic protein